MPELAKENYGNHVTVADTQTITGAKTFSGGAAIKGSATAAAAGDIGERVFVRGSGVALASSNAVRGVATMSIPSAGVWEIKAYAAATFSGDSLGAALILSTTSASSGVFSEHGQTSTGYSDVVMSKSGFNANAAVGCIVGVTATFSAAATIYINMYTAATVSSSDVAYVCQATRVR